MPLLKCLPRSLGRFIKLPSPPGENHIILLEDVIRFNLNSIFSYFGYDRYDSWVFKVTKDAEMDIDNDISTSIIQKIEKGREKPPERKPVRFVYDKEMDAGSAGIPDAKTESITQGQPHSRRPHS